MNKKNSFAIYTLGCKLNFSESSTIARQLMENGLHQTDNPDFIIINSCAVTAIAEKKTRTLISKLHRSNKNAKIIVIGCYSELQSESIRSIDGVVEVFGTKNKMNVIQYILNNQLSTCSNTLYSYSSQDRTRSFLKIQDGCDYHCSYCTVAKARGASRSDTIEHVLDNISAIAEQNIKEVNLTGVNIGDFGRGNSVEFYDLLLAIDQQNAIPRVRISSIEPNLLSHSIIQLVAKSAIFMPHFHIPLQSGSNKILALMKRRYLRETFSEKVYQIKELIPNACIAVDMITGFPSETDQDFEESCRFIMSLPISYLHVFTYSKRPNTPAAAMPYQVPESVKKQRMKQLITISECKKQSFYEQNIDKTLPVLFEHGKQQDMMFGFSDNYIKIKQPYNEELCNKIVPITVSLDNIYLT